MQTPRRAQSIESIEINPTDINPTEIEGEFRAVDAEAINAAADFAAADFAEREDDAHPRDARGLYDINDVEDSAASVLPDSIDDVLIGQLDIRRVSVEPGDAAALSIALLNNGAEPATFVLQIEGWVDEEWFPDLPQEVTLEPGVWTTLSFAIAPPLAVDSWAGDHAFAVVLRSPQYPGRVTRLGAQLTIAPFDTFGVSALAPNMIEARRRTRSGITRFSLTNRGNQAARYRVRGRRLRVTSNRGQSGARQCEFHFRTTAQGEEDTVVYGTDWIEVQLEPGETRPIGCRLDWVGLPPLGPFAQTVDFQIIVDALDFAPHAGDAPTSEGGNDATRRILTGTLRQPPFVGVWGVAALLSLLLGGFVFAVILGVLAFLSVQNPAARVQTAPEPPVLAIMLHMEEPLPVRSQAVPPIAAQEFVAQQGTESTDRVVTVVQAGDITAPGEQSISATSSAAATGAATGASWLESDAATAARPTTGEEAVASGAVELATVELAAVELAAVELAAVELAAVELAMVQPEQVTAPGAPGNGPMGVGGVAPVVSGQGEAALAVRPFAQEPPPAAAPRMTYAQMFQDVGMRYDLDWRMLAAQAYIESGFDALALGNRGSMGLMQIQPQTWREWAPVISAVDPFDSYSNALVAGLYLDYLRRILADRGYPQTEWMLVAYNWGPDQLLTYLGAGGDWASLPVQVRNYAEDVLRIAQTLPRAN